MTLTAEVDPAMLVGYILALVRSIAWVCTCPPFGTRMVPIQVKLGLAVALTLALGPNLADQAVPLEVAPLLSAAFLQACTGIALGFLGIVLFSAVHAAGSMIDVLGGFSVAQLYDPMSGQQNAIFGRFYSLLTTVLLFATGGHLLLMRGFLTSFDAVPITALTLDSVGELAAGGLGLLFVSAVEIAAPLLAALFLADVALGLLAKAAPEMNIFLLGLPVKIMLTLLLAGLALPLLPGAVSSIAHDVVEGGLNALTGG